MQKLPVRAEWQTGIDGWSTAQRAAGRASSTIAARRDILAQLSRETSAGPWEVTTTALREWMGLQVWDTDLDRLRDRWSIERRRMVRTTLVGFYRWAHGAGLVDVDPAMRLEPVRPTEGRPRPAPKEVYREGLAKAPGARERLMLRLARDLGMRRAEVAVVHTDDVVDDVVGGQSLIVHGKGGKTRLVPLTAPLAAELRQRPRGYVFPGKADGHLSPRWVGRVVSELLEGEWTMHTLRHRFATDVVGQTRDVRVAQVLLGHGSLATTQRYVQPDGDRMRAAVELVANQT